MGKSFWIFKPANTFKDSAADAAERANLSKANFTQEFYNKVNEVIGGDNPNQFLTLLFPGIALEKTDFEYNYKQNGVKGPVVEANESRLANKLYDPYHISGADNGRTLPYQYKSALDALTPIINPDIAEAKNALRDLILNQYPYKLTKEEGDSEINTFQEVFFSLYDDYVEEMVAWSNEQTKNKKIAYDKIVEEYVQAGFIKENIYEKNEKGEPKLDEKAIKEFNKKVNDEYLTWYETYGIAYLNKVNQRMSKLLSVFSVNDMKIIEGLLDSGVGAEIQEARQTLTNTRKLTPDGGYVYPVKFNPTNWFEQLDTSFTYTDLLDSPTLISDKLGALYKRRNVLSSKLKSISEVIPEASELNAAKKELDDAYKEYQAKFDDMDNSGKTGLKTFTNGIFGLVCGLISGKDDKKNNATDETEKKKVEAEKKKVEEIVEGAGVELADPSKAVKDIIEGLFTSGKAVSTAMSNFNSSVDNYLTAATKSKTLQARADLKNSVNMISDDLEEVKEEITRLEAQLKLSAYAGTDADADPLPNSTPPGYSSFMISYENKNRKEKVDENVSVSTTTKSSGAWIFKDKKTETETTVDINNFYESKETSIEIGMNIAKVGIEREWFNPGVFTISDDMYRLSTKNISRAFEGDELPEYDPNNYIFPCYPVAMLLARDVTVKLTSLSSALGCSAHEFEEKVSKSTSLLFYNKGGGNSSTSSHSKTVNGQVYYTVTVRIPTPQVIGFYLENTPTDKSKEYDSKQNMFYITDFVNAYKKVINDKIEVLKKID